MIQKLRLKFICINMAMVTVMLIVIFGLVLRSTQESLESESIRMMESIGTSPMQQFTPGDVREEISLPYFVLRIDRLGNVTSIGGGYYDLSDVDFLMEVLSDAMEAEGESGVISKYHLRFLWVSSMDGQRIVFADTTSEEATLASLTRNCVMVGLLSFAAFLGLSLYLSGWAVKPVAKAWAQQKQFVADASHELKTPLTVILTNAELLQSPDTTEEDRLRFSGSILTMSRQMRSLVERLLELARMDNNASNMVMESLDFSGLVADALLPFEPLFFERGLVLRSNLTEGITLTGSREHLCQVLDILLDNAMKYTDGSGSVWVYLKRQGNLCILAVSNPGDPIGKEDLENIFKRFYRVDKARTRDGGYGLGLPIAQSIVTEHRGRIRAESAGGYNTFFLELPAAAGGQIRD